MADLFAGQCGATFSGDRRHRYALWRIWDEALPLVAAILLNSSKADERDNDPTIERQARRFGRSGAWGGIIQLNAFALCSTDPKALYGHPDPVGALNDDAIREAVARAPFVLVGWGKHCRQVMPERPAQIRAILREAGIGTAYCLGRNNDGSPKHPLYVAYAAPLEPYEIESVP